MKTTKPNTWYYHITKKMWLKYKYDSAESFKALIHIYYITQDKKSGRMVKGKSAIDHHSMFLEEVPNQLALEVLYGNTVQK